MSIRNTITAISRLLVGVLFIFSGLIKANDPMGFGYKLQEYFDVFGIPELNPIAFFLAMAISVFEIFVGITLLLGVYRKFTVWVLLLMIVFFTFLTFYSAYFNKVTDCGCFGDAIKLTPWQSFGKDIILLVLILILFINQKYIRPIMDRTVGRTISFFGLGLSFVFTLYAFYYLPPIDFRPYAKGNNIKELMELPPGAPTDSFVMTFIYQNKTTGERKEYTINELGNITDNDSFIDRIDKQIRVGDKPPIHDFAIFSPEGDDLTEQFLSEQGYRLMIVHIDVAKSDEGAQSQVNEIATWARQNNIPVWGLTASSPAFASEYRKKHNIPYVLHTADGTLLKTMIRSNPGIFLFKDNVVVEKWPSTSLPGTEELAELTK